MTTNIFAITMKRYIHIICVLAVLCSFSSCYKIFRTCAPKEVIAGETFQVMMTVIDDGDENQKFVKDWSMAGVRVPKGWTVSPSSGCHEQFAEEWVYYEDGTKVAKKSSMQLNEKLTMFYNQACPKTDYEWFGFQSRQKLPKFISACWRNGCDSIRVTFDVTVPEGTKPGKYTVDFIGGDEEDDSGIDKYSDLASVVDSRVFHVGTFSYSKFKHSSPQHSLQVEVKAATAIAEVNAEANADEPVYSVDGKRTQKVRKGLNIIGGKKIIK